MLPDPILTRILPVLAEVSGIAASSWS